MNSLEGSLREALIACVAKGMVLPFIVTAVAINGSLFAMRVRGDGSPGEQIASGGGDFALPINIMVVDADGEAARVSIVRDGTVSVH